VAGPRKNHIDPDKFQASDAGSSLVNAVVAAGSLMSPHSGDNSNIERVAA